MKRVRAAIRDTRTAGAIRVDAVGFEPTASPLQGERSTADLRAPVEGARRCVLAYVNDSSQSEAHGWT